MPHPPTAHTRPAHGGPVAPDCRRRAASRPTWRPLLLPGLLLTGALVIGAAAPVSAYVPGLEEMYARVALQEPAVQRAVLETRTYVFDPLRRSAGGGDLHPDAEPPKLEGHSFRQKMYWIRNAFLGIETTAEDGTPLHFYLREGFEPIQSDLSPTRRFAEADVVHPFLPFLSADPARWRQAIGFWGLNPQGIKVARDAKGEPLYRLYEGETAALWLEPQTLRPVRLRTQILGPDPLGRTLTIEFSEFMFIGEQARDEENLTFPRTVNFLLDGHLFKQTVLLRFEANPSTQGFPITRLRRQAAQVQSQRQISLQPQAGGSP